MKRLAFGLAALIGLFAQSGIEAPFAGYARDGAGELRPVLGIAGNFRLGEPILKGVTAAAFNGAVGLARTAEGLYAFDRVGRLLGPMATDWATPPLPIFIENDELVHRKADGTEIRAKVEGQILGIEQMGEEWFTLHQPDRRLAVRLAVDRFEISRLPEASR